MTRADLCDLVMAVDPAGSHHRQGTLRTSARMATAVVGQDRNRHLFVCAMWAERTSTEAFMEHILDTYRTWNPRWIGIEANAMQVLFGEALVLYARDRGISLPYVPIYPPTNVDKRWRIRQAVDLPMREGRLILQPPSTSEGFKILWQEMTDFPNSVTVDCIDVLAHAIAMLPSRPREARVSMDRENLAAALRVQGVAPHLIERRMLEYDAEIAGQPAPIAARPFA